MQMDSNISQVEQDEKQLQIGEKEDKTTCTPFSKLALILKDLIVSLEELPKLMVYLKEWIKYGL
jgi:hypothetical protein